MAAIGVDLGTDGLATINTLNAANSVGDNTLIAGNGVGDTLDASSSYGVLR